MKIAIIGAGKVGTALGGQLIKLKHEVIYGTKDSSSPASLSSQSAPAAQAIAGAEVVFLTVPWAAAKGAVTALSDWKGKILIDCTNPIKQDFSGLEIGHTTSGAEQIQSWAKGARVVKCFNQTGLENMADTSFTSGKPCMYAAGEDGAAVKIVAGLAREIGFETIELPSLSMARQLEQIAWLWIYTAFKTPWADNLRSECCAGNSKYALAETGRMFPPGHSLAYPYHVAIRTPCGLQERRVCSDFYQPYSKNWQCWP